MREAIATLGLGIAVILELMGLVVSFVPGTEAGYFGIAAAASLAGLASSRRRLRIVAVVLALALAVLSWEGYVKGVRHRARLRERRQMNPSLRSTPATELRLRLRAGSTIRGRERRA